MKQEEMVVDLTDDDNGKNGSTKTTTTISSLFKTTQRTDSDHGIETKLGRSRSCGGASKRSIRTPRMNASTKKRKMKSSGTKKNGKIAGKTLEQHRRAMGNVVKENIKVEKWCIGARTHCVIKDVEAEVFQKLVLVNASSVVPTFSSDIRIDELQNIPVLVVSILSTDLIANVFGATKIKGGTRLGSWSADKCEIVYVPQTKEMRVWWTMK